MPTGGAQGSCPSSRREGRAYGAGEGIASTHLLGPHDPPLAGYTAVANGPSCKAKSNVCSSGPPPCREPYPHSVERSV